MSIMRVTRYTPRPRHGGSFPQHTLATNLDTGKQQTYLSRAFRCTCGEPLMDGDRVLPDRDVHVNCAHV